MTLTLSMLKLVVMVMISGPVSDRSIPRPCQPQARMTPQENTIHSRQGLDNVNIGIYTILKRVSLIEWTCRFCSDDLWIFHHCSFFGIQVCIQEISLRLGQINHLAQRISSCLPN